MQIITGMTEFNIKEETAVALGKFDGIHLGHRKLIADLLQQKESGMKSGMKTVIFTFDPEPAAFFTNNEVKQLMTRDEKRSWFAANGIDYLVEFPFNEKTASIKPEAFVRNILKGMLNVRVIAAGTDVSFGDRGRGGYKLLRKMSGELGYEVHLIRKMNFENREISSTFVREEVAAGHMETAAVLLGNPYSIKGVVGHGEHLGHTLGFPTVNIYPEESKLLPPNGVYFSRVRVGDRIYNGVTNIGCKPTVSDSGRMDAETYLYDFDGDIYDAEIELSILSYRRAEMKLDNIEELKHRINMDVMEGNKYFESFTHKNCCDKLS